MTIRLRRIAALAIALLLALAACGGESASTTTTQAETTTSGGSAEGPATTSTTAGPVDPYRVTMATLAPGHVQWLSYISETKGFFEEFNLEVEHIQVANSSAVVQAVAENNANFGIAQGGNLIDAVNQGGRLIAVGGIITASTGSIVAQPDITDPKQLEGKRVAAGSVEGGTGAVAKYVLKELGVDISTVTMVAIANSADRIVSLDNDAIEGSLLASPYLFEARDRGYNDFGGLKEPYLNTPLVVNTEFAAENPDAVRALVAAYQKAAAWLNDPANRDEAIQILAEGMDTEVASAEMSYVYYVEELKAFPADLAIPDASLQTIQKISEWEAGKEFDPATFDISKYYTLIFLLGGLTGLFAGGHIRQRGARFETPRNQRVEQTLNPDKIELVLSGGEIVTTTGVVKADLAIADGRIAAVMEPGLPIGGARTWDISGLTVLPGAIDTHAHLRDPGFTHKEDITTGTMAAALGGYTTVVGMPNVKPPTTTAERYQEILDLYDQRSLVDFNHNPSPTSLSEVEDMAEAGALGFKVFMIEDSGRDYPHMPGVGVHDHGELLKVCEAVAATGRPLMVHPHNQEIMSVIEERTWQRGEFDFRAYARAFLEYDGIVWDSAVSLLIRLHEATGVRMHILHLRTPRTVDLVRDAKARGLAVTAEMNSAPLFLTSDWANIEKYGPYALSTWCGPDSHEALWGALLDGTADVIGTDHAPHTREEKELGWSNMWKAHGGVPQIQHSLPLLLDAVASGKITLERVVEVTSLAPARIFGLYPKKGEIRVGADADLAIVDLRKEWVIDDSQVASKCGWTPYHGWKVRGKVVHTLVRGVPVVENGEVVGRPGLGKLAAPVS